MTVVAEIDGNGSLEARLHINPDILHIRIHRHMVRPKFEHGVDGRTEPGFAHKRTSRFDGLRLCQRFKTSHTGTICLPRFVIDLHGSNSLCSVTPCQWTGENDFLPMGLSVSKVSYFQVSVCSQE